MGVLCDWQIEKEMVITPFEPQQARPGVISFGVTSYGYDAKTGYKFKVFRPYPPGGSGFIIDPKNFDPAMLEDVDLTPVDHDWVRMKDTEYDRCPYCGKEEHKDEHGYDQGRDNSCAKSKPDHIVIPPNSFVLAETVEYFEIPRDVLAVVIGKSTYARTGLLVNVTPLEPEWKGKVTVELSNTTPLPMKVYAGEGIMQVLFLRADQVCRISYADKKGKYNNQPGVTPPRVD